MDAGEPALDLQRRGRAALSLSAGQVAELARELEPLLAGAELADVHPLPPRDLLLVFQPEHESFVRRVRLSAHPDGARFHLQHERVELHEGPVGPFFRTLADEILASRLRSLAAVSGDRIVRFELDRTPAGRTRALVLELFGRRANLILCDEGDRVLAALVPPPEGAQDPRAAPGALWRAPQRRADAREPASDPALAEALPDPGPPPRGTTEAPLSWRVERSLGAAALAAEHERAARELAERLERKHKRALALERGLEERLAASAGAERVRQDGELLLAHLNAIRRGAREIEVEDLYAESGGVRRIALDPKKSPHENAEAYFERYKKLVRGARSVGEELERSRERAAELAELCERVRAPGADCDALAREAERRGLLEPPQEPDEKKRKPAEPRKPYRSYRGLAGSEIRVGRSAADNDRLTLRHARGQDIWLHTADAPGSHVVLVLAGAKEPHPEELLDAATLAAHFSPLRGRPRARIHVARRKEVHKPRGAKPGLVSLSGGKVLDLAVQPDRLRRLLDTARSPRGEAEDAP